MDLKTVLKDEDKENLKKDEKRSSRSRSRSRSRSGDRRRRRRSSDRRSRSASPRRQRKPTPPPRKICVTKLTRNVTKDHVLEIFGNFGNITHCDLTLDRNKTWLHNGNCYVEYEKVEEAEECIKKMDGGNFNF